MVRSISIRAARFAAAGLIVAIAGSILPIAGTMAAPIHASAIPNAASGGTAISVDEYGTNRYTPLIGPAIAEGSAGELTLHSTTILNVPAGFRFNPSFGTWSVDTIECDLTGAVTVTATQVTFTVTHASTVPNCILWFVGLQVQPTNPEVGGSSGHITKTGTSAAPGGTTNYGTLTKVPGAVDELTFWTQPGGAATGGQAFPNQPEVQARDQFGNAAWNAPVTLSITPGTGPSGARLACAKNPLRADGNGVVDFSGCKIGRAGSYRLRATSGHVTRDSGTFTVAVGPATKLVFLAYPGATTKATLTPQPRVGIVDAGGNIVTTYPTTHITLGINKNRGTFTCTGFYPVAQAVNGVAQFKGCKQTTPGSGYQMVAYAGFAAVMGKVFTVSR